VGLLRMIQLKQSTLIAIFFGVILLVAVSLTYQIGSLRTELIELKNQTGTIQNFTNAQLDLDNKIIIWSQTVETRLADLNRTINEQK